MIRVVAKSTVAIEKQDEYKKLAAELVTKSREEEGCIFYGLFRDRDDARILTTLEEWKDEDSLRTHSETIHFRKIVPALGKLREANEIHVYMPVV
jgi:quinol monooxygenase YgiN